MVQIYAYFPRVKLLLAFSTIHSSVSVWKINYMVILANIYISVLNVSCIEVKKFAEVTQVVIGKLWIYD